MSSYSTGTVKLVNASSIIRADSSTNFTTNVVKGNLFKKRGEPVYYTVASVVNGTTLQLSSKYAGTSGTGLSFLITRDFTPNLVLPELSAGDQDFPDTYTRALRKIDLLFPDAITTWLEDTSSPHARVSATCFTASGDYTTIYVKDRVLKIRGNDAAASANHYSVVATDTTYNATTHLTTIRTDVTALSATPTRYYYAAAVNVLTDQIKDTHIDFGTGSNQVNASDVPIIDTIGIVSGTTVEEAITELKRNFLTFGNITATVDYNWIAIASLCTRASNDVFNASGNQTTLLIKSTGIKICATANASYFSYVATYPRYNATTGLTRVTLASQAIPATPVRWYGDTGNTATIFKLTGIAQYPDDFFNNKYYLNITTGSNVDITRQIKDWAGTSRTVTATTNFTYTPRRGARVEFYNSLSSLTITAGKSITSTPGAGGYTVAVADPFLHDVVTATTTNTATLGVDHIVERTAAHGIVFGNHIIPSGDNTLNLGSADRRIANIYTADLNLRNERGDYTVVEEEDYLSILNNKTQKRYKLLMEEI